jgi:hypothetical protein
MPAHRRGTDEEGDDFRDLRKGGGGASDAHVRWIVAVVSAAIISTLGYLAVRDRVGVDTQIQRLDNTSSVHALQLARHEAELAVIKAKQDRVLEDLRSNGNKLDQVLLALRK